jgi:hypothetical protein
LKERDDDEDEDDETGPAVLTLAIFVALAVIILALGAHPSRSSCLATPFGFRAAGTPSPRSAADGSDLRSMTSAAHVETPTSVTIVTLGYRVRCTEKGCRNVGRMILRLG